MENEKSHWIACPECQGRGKKSRRLRKKVRLQYLKELAQFEQAKTDATALNNEPNQKLGTAPVRPKGHLESCSHCTGSGLISSINSPAVETENYPHVAIIGGGIGGVALAVACLHRGIPFTLYERDSGFNARSQGYGLTLQQASRAIEGLGIFSLKDGVVSTRHVVHTTEGKIVAEWGMRKWIQSHKNTSPKRTNVHIARQSLRQELLEQLGGDKSVQWNHQLLSFHDNKSGLADGDIDLHFQVNGEIKHAKADLVVGADGIRSTMRKLIIGEETTPLRYLGCIVILGICPLFEIKEQTIKEPAEGGFGSENDRKNGNGNKDASENKSRDENNVKNTLLDSATVFQTANGNERIYIMPYDADSVMWQLSFPMSEEDAKALSEKGAQALKEEACRRTQWHFPIPQILAATQVNKISGYPVYDRELLTAELLQKAENITLIGDAAHPMSPFKGQGANQALLDALALARSIKKGCWSLSKWRDLGLRESVLTEFETEMLARSAVKVEDSAQAAEFLHSDIVLYEGDEPRGRALKRK